MRCQTFSTPKAGNVSDDYEDATFGDSFLGRFAVADGATESTFASLWAELLVKGYVQSPLVAHEWDRWLRPLQENWLAQVSGLSLPWYAEEKLAQTGAYAAFLGVSISRDGTGDSRGLWQAAAVGDSCLFQIRGGRLRRRFPVRRSVDFGTSPWLIGSRDPPERFSVSGVALWKTGEWQAHDRLWLMTDALAQWFLSQYERRRAARCPCASVLKLLEQAAPDDFTGWIGALRETGELRNDDVTLLAIDL